MIGAIGKQNLAGLALALAVLAGIWTLGSDYSLVLGFGFLTMASLAMSWNLVGGFAGQFALGHSLYVGLGGYAVAVVTVRLGLDLWLGALLAVVLSVTIAAATTALFLRMRDIYFSIATMVLALLATAITVLSPWLGQTAGIVLNADVYFTDRALFVMAVAVAALSLAVTIWVSRSSLGLSLRAIRDDASAADEAGVNSPALKCLVMALSAGLCALTGVILMLQRGTIEPMAGYSINWTIQMIMIAVIGGLGTTWGPLLGAAVYFMLQQYFEDLPNWNLLILALALLVVIRFVPEGLAGLPARLKRILAQRGEQA